jgi:two-component sensor histidine kinase
MDDASTSEQLRRQLTAFAQFTSRSIGKSDIEVLMLDACLRARAGMAMSHAKLLEYLPERDRLLLRSGVGWKDGYVGHYEVPPELDTPIGHAFAFAEPVPISDYARGPIYKYPSILKEHDCVSSLNVPVRTEDGIFGVLEVDHVTTREFTPDDISFLTGLGNTIAQAIQLRRSVDAVNAALEAKQLFAREMNHRIKNNLSLVGSMLSLHSRRIKEPAIRSELQNAIQRINNLALVHDRLQTFVQMNSEIDARSHFEELAEMLRSVVPPGVRILTDCSGALPGDCVESLTLITNELVTNSAKYAFEGRDEGEILIGFRQEGPGWRFWVHDDGIGASQADGMKTSFGTQMINALVSRINAYMYRTTTRGTCVEISFGVANRLDDHTA